MNERQILIRRGVQAFAGALPAGWTQAWLRVDIDLEGASTRAQAFAALPGDETATRPVSLPPLVVTAWRALWHAEGRGSEPWTSATLRLQASGHFDLDYEYSPDRPA